MKELVRAIMGIIGLLALSACTPDETDPRADAPEDMQGSGSREGTAAYQDPEATSPRRTESPAGETTASSTGESGDAAQAPGPDSPIQGQRPYELLAGAGVSLREIEQLESEGFPEEQVEARIRAALEEAGRDEQSAQQRARELAQRVTEKYEAGQVEMPALQQSDEGGTSE